MIFFKFEFTQNVFNLNKLQLINNQPSKYLFFSVSLLLGFIIRYGPSNYQIDNYVS